MIFQKNAIILLFTAFITFGSYAQNDTLFWFAAPEISAGSGDNPIFLRFLTYGSASTVTVSQPANGAFIPITLNIPANSVDSINLTAFIAQIESPAANVISNNGIKITASTNISAFYELRSATNKESFSLKGTKALGTNFYTPFQKFWATGVTAPVSNSSFEIVATLDNTTVLITPRTNITGHAQNVSFSVVLNKGQTYSARDVSATAVTSLAGSIISANKDVAVTVFDGALTNGGCVDAIGDQITHAGVIGTEYVIHKGTSTSDRVYILGTQNGTNVSVYNSTTTSTLINWSETYEYILTEDINYIKTNKPVYVLHVSGYGCDLSAAQVPNLVCAGTYSTAFTRTSSDSLGLIVYTRTGFENQFTLNGNPLLIPAASFSTVPGTLGNYKVARIHYSTIDVPVNSYNIVANTGDVFGLGVINGKTGSGASYSYLSNFNSYPFVSAGLDDTTCANVPFSLNGLVGGGSVTGIWSGSGYGSFSGGNSALINTYVPSPLDTLITPIQIILTSTGPCPAQKDTLLLHVNPSPIVNASADQTACANNSVISLNGSVQGGAATGIWTTLGSGTFTPSATSLAASYIPSNADITFGSVKLVLTSTNFGACLAATDTMQIVFTSQALVNAGPDTLIVCANNPNAALMGSVSGSSTTGKWITTGNGIFLPNNLSLVATYQPSAADIASGEVLLYLESTSNGNCLPVQDSILIQFTAAPIVDAGLNQITCTNDAVVTLNGTASGATTTGIWSGGAGVFTPSNTALNATYTPTAGEIGSGNVVLTLTSTNNGACISVNDIVQMNFVAPPFANFNSTDVCLGNLTTFADFSLPGYGTINSWTWDFMDLNSSTVQNPTNLYANPGTYNVQLITTTNVGCSDTVIKQVQVFAPPVANFTYVANCPNNQVIIDFTDNSTSVDPINYWFYDFGGQGSVVVANPTQLFNVNGNYSVTHIVSTVNGCSDTIVQTINVPSIPEAGFYYNTSNGLNVGAIFNFVDTSNYSTSYFWEFGNVNTSTLQNPSNTYFANGVYEVTQFVYGALGCYDSTTTYITINTVTTEISTLIPNAISPNGDDKNDVWKLDFINLLFPDATVEIYNSWGQQLFFSNAYPVQWDGKYNGEFVPDGNYYYVITLNANLEVDQFKGALLVLKNIK